MATSPPKPPSEEAKGPPPETAGKDARQSGADAPAFDPAARDNPFQQMAQMRPTVDPAAFEGSMETLEELTREIGIQASQLGGAEASHQEATDWSDPTLPPSNHPIHAVAGKFARVEDIIALKLEDGDNAFSISTQDVLRRAVAYPARESLDGEAIIDPGSLLKAAAIKGAGRSPGGTAQPTHMDEILAAFVRDATRDDKRAPDVWHRTPAGAERIEAALADPALTRALNRAAQLVEILSAPQERVDIRHALFAALETVEGQRALLDQPWVERGQDAFDALVQRVFTPFSHFGDDPEAIGYVQSETPRLHPEALHDHRSEIHHEADRAVTTLEQDALGVAPRVQALAEVMSLREPAPTPLAIGLFGEWGSGKSSFMHMLRGAVERIKTRAAANPELPFVRNPVHIWFNAWHYTDGNLWASLANEFFAQLRVGGMEGRKKQAYKEIASAVGAHVSEAAVQAATAAYALDQAHEEMARIDAAIETLQAKREAAWRELLIARASSLLQIGQENADEDAEATPPPGPETARARADAHAALRALGQSLDVAGAEAAIRDAASLGGTAASVAKASWRMVTGRIPIPRWALGGLILALGAVVLGALDIAGVISLGAFVGYGLEAVGPLLALVAAGFAALKRIAPLLGAARAYKDELAAARQQIEADLGAEREARAKAERRVEEAKEAQAEAEKEAARYRDETPQAMFDFFLNRSEQTKAFEEELGIVSRVRSAFEKLDAILAEQRKAARDAGDDTTAPAPGPAPIDRIILYIDDLDRCRVEQVIRVLEAVHLLLAFDMFVVVVGVDPRWLENSLLQFYDKQLRASADRTGVDDDRGNRATVLDYLEKIFQIPVRLSQRTVAGEGFDRLVAQTVGTATRDADAERADALPPGDGEGRGTAHGATTIAPVTPRLPADDETDRETIKRITLRPEEVAIITRLGPIAGKSPRAMKRFVNLYRLVRGTHRGGALDLFLDGGVNEQDPLNPLPTYPAALFWLALAVGRPLEEATRIRRAFAALDAEAWPGLLPFVEAVAPSFAGSHGPAAERRETLARLDTALPGTAGYHALAEALRQTRHFAFVGH